MPRDELPTEVVTGTETGPPADPGSAQATPLPSALPARYRDLGPIARGSFGEVRRVHDTLLERVAAMKLLHPHHVPSPRVRQRFLAEIEITAGLQHPGIVAVHDRGELPDRRLWFTMREVRGRTLESVIADLHAAKRASGWRPTPDGFTFRRVVDAFARITQAMVYAHGRGIVHRDLKPANLMVGELGEVLVMDWGLARKMGVAEVRVREAVVELATSSAGFTRHGEVLGTPAFMPPEQASGDVGSHGPASDVYALGAILYSVLTGQSPYSEEGASEVLSALRSGPPRDVREAARGGPPVPEELCSIVDRAMRRDSAERYPSAEALARDVVAWLDGLSRREQALAAIDRARALAPEIAHLRKEAEESDARARAILAEVKPFAPVEKKRPAWKEEDEAARLNRAAALAEARWLGEVHGALSLDPDTPEAHAMLADHHRQRLVEAERAGRDEDAARAEEWVRAHDRGQHAAFLRGDGALTLVTDPPGARVVVERYELHDRRLCAVEQVVVGPTPLLEVPLQRGSYLLRIQAEGRVEVRYPVWMERGGHWDGRAPGEAAPRPIRLPTPSELGPEDVVVPAGYCWVGGDPEAPDSLPSQRVWIDGFVIQRHPVTAGEYLTFLNDLVARGREAEAIAASPKAQLSLTGHGEHVAFDRDAAGQFHLAPDRHGLRWRPDWPVVLVDWHAAMAYACWMSERTGLPFRLPGELEREKAARGVDGRLLPWGNHGDPTFVRVIDTTPDEPSRESVFDRPSDESPYGVRGLAGNTRDWCLDAWRHRGPEIVGGRLLIVAPAPEDGDFRVIKGGAWSSTILHSRAAARFGARPHMRRPVVGFRLVRPEAS